MKLQWFFFYFTKRKKRKYAHKRCNFPFWWTITKEVNINFSFPFFKISNITSQSCNNHARKTKKMSNIYEWKTLQCNFLQRNQMLFPIIFLFFVYFEMQLSSILRKSICTSSRPKTSKGICDIGSGSVETFQCLHRIKKHKRWEEDLNMENLLTNKN